MFSLEYVYSGIWDVLTTRTELLQLLNITPYTGVYPPVLAGDIALYNAFMTQCKAQFFEGQNSDTGLTTSNSKIQMTEGVPSIGQNIQINKLFIYSWVTKDNNRKTRVSLKIADQLVKALDKEERWAQGLPPIKFGVGDLREYSRDPYARVDTQGWDCYGVVFTFDRFKI